jgi:predicted DCC family thiol-disulfide oxidoreductase YuxK
MNLSLLNSLCYTVGWFWSVLFGIHGQPILAAIGAVVLILFQLYFTKSKNLNLYIKDLLLVFFSVPLGFVLEMVLIQTNLKRDSKNILELLYDGECPICKREICILQKKESQSRIKFIDISSKQFLPSMHKNIDYNSGMTQIHAIDGKGNLLVGLPTFAAVYARNQLLITSTLLRIPFIRILLTPLYRLFAKKRLWITGRTNSTKLPKA